MTLGPWEIIVVLLIVLVIFGAGRLSEVGGAVGSGIREFRKASSAGAPARAAIAPPPVAASAPAVSPVVTIENNCPSCATVNPAGQVFCGQCGTRLTPAA